MKRTINFILLLAILVIAPLIYVSIRNSSDYYISEPDFPSVSEDIDIPTTPNKTVISGDYIDFNNFSEKRMSDVLFVAMNDYQKKIHNGDSLIRSSLIERTISRDNYNYFKNNCEKPPYDDIMRLHNPRWYDIDRDGNPDRIFNDLPDTIKVKVINEMKGTHFLRANWDNHAESYILTYGEIIGEVSFEKLPIDFKYTYTQIANDLIKSWNESKLHTNFLNGDYNNAVIVGSITYYHKKRRTVYVSFVYIS